MAGRSRPITSFSRLPSKEVWDDILRKRAEFERLRDGDTDEDVQR